MSLKNDRDDINRRLIESDQAQCDQSQYEQSQHERAHRADLRRRRAAQGLATLGLMSAAAREAYRRDVLASLPSARLLIERGRSQLEDDDPADDALANRYRWKASMRPSTELLNGPSIGVTSSHAASLVLSALGGTRRAEQRPWLSIADAGFSALRAVAAGRRVLNELEDGHLDLFTTLDAVTSIAAVPLTVPEAVRALRGLLGR